MIPIMSVASVHKLEDDLSYYLDYGGLLSLFIR